MEAHDIYRDLSIDEESVEVDSPETQNQEEV
jgi:hypothetical protein